MKNILSAIARFLRLGVAVNTTTLASKQGVVPGGITPDNTGMWGLFGFMANSNLLDSANLVAVAGGAATAVTLTAAQFLTNIIDFGSSASSGIAMTTPTRDQIIAALPPTAPRDGFNFIQRVMADVTGQTITYTAGANVTLRATTATIASGTASDFLVNININANTVIIVGIGGNLSL